MGGNARLKAQWNLKKNGKEEELSTLQHEIEEAKKLMGEEELVILDLNEEIGVLKEKRDKILQEVRASDVVVRQKYSRMLEALQNYNERLKEEFDAINATKLKILGGPGAL